jgi:diguanylate cyclase (GGDEF)-like protein/PAS domain S-box-containing protein
MDTDAALRSLLAAHPDAVVAAIGLDGRPCAVPATVPLVDHEQFLPSSALAILVPEDQVEVVDLWARAQVEPLVSAVVHLLADPDRPATLHIVDVREVHGAHVVLLDGQNLDTIRRSDEASGATRRDVATMKRDGVALILDVDAPIARLVGWEPHDLIGRRTMEFVHPDDVEDAIGSWMQMRNSGGRHRSRVRMRHADGHYVWLEVTNENHLDDEQDPCVISHLVDISDEMAELEALQQRERLLARLAEALPIGICQLRSDRAVVYTNEPMIALVGKLESLDALVDRVAPSDRTALDAVLEAAFDGRSGYAEVGIAVGLEERRCEITARPLSDDVLDGVILCAADVTDRSRMRAELEHRASHDALTGCLNRAATTAVVDRLLRDGRTFALTFIDLDGFKEINDEFGHAAGDEVLRVAAARLRGAIRSDDFLGRIGGDEFVVICVSDGALDPDQLRERLAGALQGAVTFARQAIPVRASVGVAPATGVGLDVEALLQRADAEMYADKRSKMLRVVEVS